MDKAFKSISESPYSKVYVDLATTLGIARFIQTTAGGQAIITFHTNLEKFKREEIYKSSQKRKTSPTDRTDWTYDNGFYYLMKRRQVVVKRNLREQLQALNELIEPITRFCYVVLEDIAVPFGTINISSFHKQSMLYGVVEHASNVKYRIAPNEWFNAVREHIENKFKYKPFEMNKENLTIWTTGKTKKIINRKKSSINYANYIKRNWGETFANDDEITDHNEADALCMMYYDQVIRKDKEKWFDLQ